MPTDESSDGISRRRFLEGTGAGAAALLAGCAGDGSGGDSGETTDATEYEDPTTGETTDPTTEDTTTTPEDPLETVEYQPFQEVHAHLEDQESEYTEEFADAVFDYESGELYESAKPGLEAITAFDDRYWEKVAGHVAEKGSREGKIGWEDSLYMQTLAEAEKSGATPGISLVDDFTLREDQLGLVKPEDSTMYTPTLDHLDLEEPDERLDKVRDHLYRIQGEGIDESLSREQRARQSLQQEQFLLENRLTYLEHLATDINKCYSRINQLDEFGKLYALSKDGQIGEEELRMVEDRDGDHLIYIKEQRLGTDPTDEDTDGDGFLDSWEALNIVNGDPTVKDVFLEVDYQEGVEPPREAFQRIEVYLEDNPHIDDGKGIQLHVNIDEEIPAKHMTDDEIDETANRHFQNQGEGYSYMILAPPGNISRPNVLGLNVGEMASEPVPSTIAHELYGNLGVLGWTVDGTNVLEGANNDELPYSEYPSAMNYNAPDQVIELTPEGLENIELNIEHSGGTSDTSKISIDQACEHEDEEREESSKRLDANTTLRAVG